MSDRQTDGTAVRDKLRQQVESRRSARKAAEAELAKIRADHSRSNETIPILRKIGQDGQMKKGTATPASGGGLPEPRQIPPLPRAVANAASFYAAHLGLDVEELALAAQAARAAREATESATTAPLEEAKRLKAIARLWGLQLDLYQRKRAIAFPVGGFRSDREAAAAARLSKTYSDMRNLEHELGLKITDKDPIIKKAESFRTTYLRSDANSGSASRACSTSSPKPHKSKAPSMG